MGSKIILIKLTGDGIFDRLTNYEIMSGVWSFLTNDENEGVNRTRHNISGSLCDLVLKMSLARHTMDNISCIFISFRKRLSKYEKIIYDHFNRKRCL